MVGAAGTWVLWFPCPALGGGPVLRWPRGGPTAPMCPHSPGVVPWLHGFVSPLCPHGFISPLCPSAVLWWPHDFMISWPCGGPHTIAHNPMSSKSSPCSPSLDPHVISHIPVLHAIAMFSIPESVCHLPHPPHGPHVLHPHILHSWIPMLSPISLCCPCIDTVSPAPRTSCAAWSTPRCGR